MRADWFFSMLKDLRPVGGFFFFVRPVPRASANDYFVGGGLFFAVGRCIVVARFSWEGAREDCCNVVS